MQKIIECVNGNFYCIYSMKRIEKMIIQRFLSFLPWQGLKTSDKDLKQRGNALLSTLINGQWLHSIFLLFSWCIIAFYYNQSDKQFHSSRKKALFWNVLTLAIFNVKTYLSILVILKNENMLMIKRVRKNTKTERLCGCIILYVCMCVSGNTKSSSIVFSTGWSLTTFL